MDSNVGALLNAKQTIINYDNSLVLWEEGQQFHRVADGFPGVEFLTASPDGKHFAFFSYHHLYLMDITGKRIWEGWINPDKSDPYGIYFSKDGDAVAFTSNYGDSIGHYCLFIFIIGRGKAIELTSHTPIGSDINLKFFGINSEFYLREYDIVCLSDENVKHSGFMWNIELSSEMMAKEETIRNSLKQGPIIVDRDMNIYSENNHDETQSSSWRSMAIQENARGIAVLYDNGELKWFSSGSNMPEATVKDCISPKLFYGFQRFCHFVLTANDEIVLVHPAMIPHALLANRRAGVVWEAENLISARVIGQRVLAQYTDGTIEVIQSMGLAEVKAIPPDGCETVAANIFGDVLKIAYLAEDKDDIKFITLNLR